MLVMIGGGAEALSIAIAVVLVLTRRAWAAQAAIVVGFGTALASTFGHLLPAILPGLQDSFVSPPHTGVTWYSWVSLAAAMVTGILFGFAGIWAARNQHSRAQARTGSQSRRR
jgi:predicted lysophospholipase L1 biosynthesis ABC-type transport system permease subunit